MLSIAVQDAVPVVTQLGAAKENDNWLAAPAPEVLLPSVWQQGFGASNEVEVRRRRL